MWVGKIGDVREFRRRADPLLLADEVRHTVILSVLRSLEHDPDRYPRRSLWLASDAGEAQAAALWTPLFRALVARPRSRDALAALVDHLLVPRLVTLAWKW